MDIVEIVINAYFSRKNILPFFVCAALLGFLPFLFDLFSISMPIAWSKTLNSIFIQCVSETVLALFFITYFIKKDLKKTILCVASNLILIIILTIISMLISYLFLPAQENWQQGFLFYFPFSLFISMIAPYVIFKKIPYFSLKSSVGSFLLYIVYTSIFLLFIGIGSIAIGYLWLYLESLRKEISAKGSASYGFVMLPFILICFLAKIYFTVVFWNIQAQLYLRNIKSKEIN